MILKYLKVACFILLGSFASAQHDPIAFTFNPTTGDPVPGGVYDVEVFVSDFEEILSAQFTVLWDSSVLQIDTIPFISALLPDLNDGVFTLPQETMTPVRGRLRISWLSFSLLPQNLPDDTHLFTMRFNVPGMPCDTTSLTIGEIPFVPIEVVQEGASKDNIGAIGTHPVAIPGTDCEIDPPPPPPPPSDCEDGDYILTFSDLCASPGDNVCIPMTVSNFTDVITFQGSVKWDSLVLSYTGVQNFDVIPGMSLASFGNPSKGVGTFLWFDLSGGSNAQTLTDGTAVFDFCFDVIGNTNTSSGVEAFSSTVPGETLLQISSNSGIVDVCTEEGIITVLDNCGGGDDDFTLIAEKVNVSPSDTRACVDITVENFEDIVGMQFTLQWDPSILSYSNVENLNMADLNISDFLLNPIGDDRLRFSWAETPPRTVSDGTALFTVCYDVLAGNSGNISPVNFIDDGQFSRIEISEVGDVVIDYALRNGCVDIGDGPQGPDVSSSVTDVRCNGDDNGSITLTITGNGPFDCDWTGPNLNSSETGVTSECRETGLVAGRYDITVTDANGLTTEVNLTVDEPNPLEIDELQIFNITDSRSGEIRYDISGGTRPYEELWTNDIDPRDIPNPGNYTLVVTDDNGCTAARVFIVEDDRTSGISVSFDITDATSCEDDGIICITCSGGSGTFLRPTISPNEGDWDPVGGCYVNVPAGFYTITCTDSNGSTRDKNVEVEERSPASIRIDLDNIVDADCNNEGSFDLEVTGGCPTYLIEIGLEGGSKSRYRDNDTYPAGEYEICVTDSRGDTRTRRLTIREVSPDIRIAGSTVTDAICNGMDGAVALDIENLCGTQICMIDIGNTNNFVDCELVNGQIICPVGDHTITVQDSQTNAISSISVSVGVSPDAFSVVVVNMGDCFVDVQPSGELDPVSYNWTGPAGFTSTSQNLSNLPAPGLYTLNAEDGNGCPVVLEVVVSCDVVNEFGVTVDNGGISASLCAPSNGDCSGTVSVDVSGGMAPYIIVLTDQNSVASTYNVALAGSTVLDGLCGGSYVLTAEDADGTIVNFQETVIVEGPEPIVIEEDNIVCSDPDDNTGSISAIVTGGSGGLVYDWTPDSPEFTGPTIEDLPAGNYLLSVSDVNNCEEEFLFTVESCRVTSPDCNDGISVITPNADNVNDFFVISCAENTDNTLAIYDRWSRPVYKGSNYQNDWNGTDLDGQPLIEGAYYWVYQVDGQLFKGTVTLLRD